MFTIPLGLIALTILLECAIIFRSVPLSYRSSSWILAPPLVLTVYFLVVQLPGILWVAYDQHAFRPAIAAALALGGTMAALLCFLFIFRGPISPPSHKMHPPRSKRLGIRFLIWFAILVGIAAAAFTFAMYGRVPLFYAIQGTLFGSTPELTMHQARQMNTLQHRSGDTIYFGQGYLRLIFLQVSPLFVSVLYLRRKIQQDNVVEAYVLMGLFSLIGLLNGQIWVTLHMMIFFLLVIVYWMTIEPHHTERQRLGKILFLGVCAFIAALAFIFGFRTLQFLSGRNIDDLMYSSIARIFAYPQAELFHIFPNDEPFRYGTTWWNDLRGVLPGSIQSFSYEVHALVYRSAWGFTLAPGMIASAYVNFGMPGVFATFFVLTFIYIVLHRLMSRSLHMVDQCLAVYISYGFAINLLADLSAYAVSIGFVAILWLLYHSAECWLRSINMALCRRTNL
jgi:hypothetical protein